MILEARPEWMESKEGFQIRWCSEFRSWECEGMSFIHQALLRSKSKECKVLMLWIAASEVGEKIKFDF